MIAMAVLSPAFIGAAMAVGVAVFARLAGFDRERGFYPTLLIFIATYYGLFAIMGGSAWALGLETIVMAIFAVIAVIGYARSRWIVVAGLAGHGVFDLVHQSAIHGSGAPEWWPPFCLSFDVAAAICLGLTIVPGGGCAKRPAVGASG